MSLFKFLGRVDEKKSRQNDLHELKHQLNSMAKLDGGFINGKDWLKTVTKKIGVEEDGSTIISYMVGNKEYRTTAKDYKGDKMPAYYSVENPRKLIFMTEEYDRKIATGEQTIHLTSRERNRHLWKIRNSTAMNIVCISACIAFVLYAIMKFLG